MMLTSTVQPMALLRLTAIANMNRSQVFITKTNPIRTIYTNSSMCKEKLVKQDGVPKLSTDQDTIRISSSSRHTVNSFVTLPNLLTTSRILMTPAIGYLVWNGMTTHALYCFTFAAFTDLIDGFLARRLKQCSQIGAILDPIADKFLMTTTFLAMYKIELMPDWLIVSFIARDLGLMTGGSVLRYFTFQQRAPTIREFFDFEQFPMPILKPTLISKCNTALQCSLIFLHLGLSQVLGFDEKSIMLLHITTACTTAISFGQYIARPFIGKNAINFRS